MASGTSASGVGRPLRLLDLGKRHLHRRHPVPTVIQAHVVGLKPLAVVGELRRAAYLLSLPRPGVTLDAQLFRDQVALAVEVVRAVHIARIVVADDLGTAHIRVSHTAVRRVKDEKPARHPLVDVAREYLDGGRIRARHGMHLGDPPADEHVQEFVLGSRLAWLPLSVEVVVWHDDSSFR